MYSSVSDPVSNSVDGLISEHCRHVDKSLPERRLSQDKGKITWQEQGSRFKIRKGALGMEG
jgi:hypothetical protein